jgi:hypothetical protein
LYSRAGARGVRERRHTQKGGLTTCGAGPKAPAAGPQQAPAGPSRSQQAPAGAHSTQSAMAKCFLTPPRRAHPWVAAIAGGGQLTLQDLQAQPCVLHGAAHHQELRVLKQGLCSRMDAERGGRWSGVVDNMEREGGWDAVGGGRANPELVRSGGAHIKPSPDPSPAGEHTGTPSLPRSSAPLARSCASCTHRQCTARGTNSSLLLTHPHAHAHPQRPPQTAVWQLQDPAREPGAAADCHPPPAPLAYTQIAPLPAPPPPAPPWGAPTS